MRIRTEQPVQTSLKLIGTAPPTGGESAGTFVLLKHRDDVSASSRVDSGAQASNAGANYDDFTRDGVHACDSSAMRRTYGANFDAYGASGNVWVNR